MQYVRIEILKSFINFFYSVPCLLDLTNDETLMKFWHTLALPVNQVRNV